MDRIAVEIWCGLDLGQTHDPSALSIIDVERARVQFDWLGHLVDNPIREEEQVYNIRHVERLPLHTPYPKIVQYVGQVLQAIPRAGRGYSKPGRAEVKLVVDQTGVGRPVVDMFEAAGIELIPITITGGDAVSDDWPGYRVPKRDLVSRVQVLIQTRRLRMAAALPAGIDLEKEMANFQYQITAKAHDTYNARQGAYDDLLLSVALPCWAAQNAQSRQAVWAPAPEWLRQR